jgi:lipopolysaccharide biosynthesis glycosyltransferase
MTGNPKDRGITVVFCSDNNYAMQLGVSLKSLVLNHSSHTRLEIFILADAISPENRQRLLGCAAGLANVSIKWIEVDANLTAGFRPKRRVTRTAYARLFIPQLLPAECLKAIYLDDIIVNEGIEELWMQDLRGHCILAAQDYENLVSTPKHFPNYQAVGIPAGRPYFNSGVLVVNLELWRMEGITQRCVQYLKEFDSKRVFNDQEALNAVLFDRWLALDRHWNWQEPYTETAFPGVCRRWMRRLLGKERPMRPAIIHFCGMRKPWQPGYLGRGRRVFYRYLDQTPWAGWRASMAADLRFICMHEFPRAINRLIHLRYKQGA